jgi:FKBP-type peptidyl-prolyl cis-trans isomerase FkpA
MAFETGSTGLGIDDVLVGTGDTARAGRQVTVHYTGWLWAADAGAPEGGRAGAKFDSSKDRGQPFDFALGAGHVIAGWDQGVAGMKVGGKRRLLIPASLGYGARGAGGVIPPDATLLFEVDLLSA